MKNVYVTILYFFYAGLSFSQTNPEGPYLGEIPPGSQAKIFSPSFISLPNNAEGRLCFSADMKMLFFSRGNFNGTGDWRLLYSVCTSGVWSDLEDLTFLHESGYNQSFSPDGYRIIYDGNYMKPGNYYTLWYNERTDTSWSDPLYINIPIPVDGNRHHPTIASSGNIYFKLDSPNPSIYMSTFSDSGYLMAELIIEDAYNPFVAPDESFLLFNSWIRGPQDYGFSDLYVMYKKDNGDWTVPKNLGPNINTYKSEFDPILSPDGKYIFFTSWADYSPTNSAIDVYWVDAGIIDELRNSNFIPYVKNRIPDTSAIVGQYFHYQIPHDTFIDDDDDDTLTYRPGEPLAEWLTFDPNTLTLSGIPVEAGLTRVKIFASDPDGEEVSDLFRITVTEATGVHHSKELPVEYKLFQNYPNPFNPSTVIQYSLSKSSNVDLNIYNIQGQKIKTLVNILQQRGRHQVTWDATDNSGEKVSSGIYIYQLQSNEGMIQKKMLLLH